MILDSSALVAIALREHGYERLQDAAAAADRNAVGAPTLVEAGVVLHRRVGGVARTILQRLLDDSEIDVIPFSDRHWPVAVRAYARFGKGRHPAALNLGDCFTYATASVAGEPLLCVGDDFAQTDLALA